MEENTNLPQSNSATQKPYNLEPNVEAALSYLIAPITGIIVFVFEKDNKFIRFHAMQSILFGIATFIAKSIAVFTIPLLIGELLMPVVSIGFFVLWLLLMWKAYNNEEWELPYIGKIARDQINK
jgi:uncharacterized membrane protein